ncbi:MAG: helix-turn-helix domain-containing protein [Dehalococcoidia bacterium]
MTLTKDTYLPSEVADLFGVSLATVYRWIESGRIIPLLVIPPYRIPRQEIENLLSPPR